MALAKEWLTSCLEKHPICRPPAVTPLPTRVIDVGDLDIEARLYVTKGESAQYAALSHCWGSRIPVSTTAVTLEDRLKSIKFDASSKTFAEAVHVTRRLGIRYLWIDSLCIIQKSEDDWATEAGRMSDVFRNATVMLSADAARDASEGLLGDKTQRQRMQQIREISCTGLDGQSATVHVRLRATHPSDSDRASHASVPCEGTKLSSRAWVVQERLLSPRILHFFHEEMAWSCSSCTRCECRLLPGSSYPGVFRKKATSDEAQGQFILSLALEWPKIVMNFTGKELSFASDRLPAISGLAGLIHQRTFKRYLAGLWSFDMSYQMLWFSDHGKAGLDLIERHSRDKSPQASWSWASVTGPVRYFDRHQDQFQRRSGESEVKPLLEVTEGWTEPAGPNAYGPVKTGIVTVIGQVLPVKYNTARSVWRPDVKPFDQEDPHVEPDVTFDVVMESPALSEGMASLNYAFLRAATYISGGMWSTPNRENVCLLLMRLGGHGLPQQIYRRIGFVMFGFSSDTVWKSAAAATKQTLLII